jgi:hypothetical protein
MATVDQHTFYNKANGVLSYDADDNGAGHAIVFARQTLGANRVAHLAFRCASTGRQNMAMP